MFNSFSSALSALKGHSAAIDVVGNNLANVNTTGFKASEVAFKDLVSESMSAKTEMGMGVSKPITVRTFTQGAIQSSSGKLDAAIQGNGFFVVKEGEATLYTRDGGFEVDANGFVRTRTGEKSAAAGERRSCRYPYSCRICKCDAHQDHVRQCESKRGWSGWGCVLRPGGSR